MVPTNSGSFDEAKLTRGQLRKLNTLRKSVGNKIGDKAFADWLAKQSASNRDKNADLITDTLWPLVQERKLAIPRGGYVVKRGRGRLVVERAKR